MPKEPDTILSVRLPEDLKTRAEAFAAITGISFQEVVRVATREKIEQAIIQPDFDERAQAHLDRAQQRVDLLRQAN